MTSSPFIDWSLIGHIVLVSILAGVGVVAVFSLGLVALAVGRDEARSTTWRALGVSGTVLAAAALVFALGWGFELITNKG